MMNTGQNRQIEMLSALALRNKGYSWNSIPISDSQSEDPNFQIVRPMKPLRRELAASSRRRENALIQEPYDNPKVRTQEYTGMAPRDPYTTPASVVPYEEGERLIEQGLNPGPQNPLTGDKILALLDRMIQRKKRSRDERAPHGANRPSAYVGQSGVMRQEDDEEPEGDERTGREREQHVSNDRAAAFDAVMPLSGEILQTWHGWLHKKINAQGPASPWFKSLGGFLERAKAGRRFCDLSARERDLLGRIVKQIVESAA